MSMSTSTIPRRLLPLLRRCPKNPSTILSKRNATTTIHHPHPTAHSHHQGSGINPRDNPFNRERAELKAHAVETAALWKKISIYVAVPTVLLASINAYNLWNAHWEHERLEGKPLEERTEYSYMNIRAKKFPWKDGDKTLFWNDKVNYHKRDD